MARNACDMSNYVQWDVSNWSRALDFWLLNCGQSAFSGAEVLEVGSQDGGLSLWFADQGASKVVCSDLNGPTDAARQLHAVAGVSSRIEYASTDATNIGLDQAFDVIAFKSVLASLGGVGGYEAQRKAVRSMHAALRPGGVLLFAENLSASPLHSYLRRRFVSWGDQCRYVTQQEMDAFLESFSEVREETFGFAGAFGRSERQRATLARLDIAGLDRAVPSPWRYIIAGVAKR